MQADTRDVEIVHELGQVPFMIVFFKRFVSLYAILMSFPCPTCDANTLFAPGHGRARGSVYTG